MYTIEKPIISAQQDLLKRRDFSYALAESILNYTEKDSLSIGLFAPWGAGKTSIINMIVERIQQMNVEERAIIIQFNPWLFSDQQQLITEFFKQMSLALGRIDHSEDAKKVGKKLEVYASFFDPFTSITGIGKIATLFKGVFSSVGRASKEWGELKSKDLETIRADINRLLEKQNKKILIVIDDIDRLNNTEIRQIFQLVKAVGDFSNTIYILPFDKSIVINALSKVQEGDGKLYLEKIIQVPFEIPPVSYEYVEKMLFKELDVQIQDIPGHYWDEGHWAKIYPKGMKSFFNNIRDVRRYMNALTFGYALVKQEVNPIDFFAITALQVFEPQVFRAVQENKSLFSGAAGEGYYTNRVNEKEMLRKQCDELVSYCSEGNRGFVLEMLKELFPRLKYMYGNEIYGTYWLKEWRKTRRICSPDVFETYFKLSINDNDITSTEMESSINKTTNKESFRQIICDNIQNNKIGRFLERMEDFTDREIMDENIINVIMALLEVADDIPDIKSGFLNFGVSTRVLRILYQLLKRIKNREEKFKIFKLILNSNNNSVLYSSECLINELGRYKPESSDGIPLEERLEEIHQDELKNLVVMNIKRLTIEDRLFIEKNSIRLLYIWSQFDDPEEVKKYVQQYCKPMKNLLRFLVACLSESEIYSSDTHLVKKEWKISIKAISEWLEIEDVQRAIESIVTERELDIYTEQERLAIQLFLNALNKKDIEEP